MKAQSVQKKKKKTKKNDDRFRMEFHQHIFDIVQGFIKDLNKIIEYMEEKYENR